MRLTPLTLPEKLIVVYLSKVSVSELGRSSYCGYKRFSPSWPNSIHASPYKLRPISSLTFHFLG